MPHLNPFIHFNGNAEEAFEFYRSVFGGNFSSITRFKDVKSLQSIISKAEENKIMQIALEVGKNSFLLGSDVPEFMGKVNEQENRSKIAINTDSKEEAEKIYNRLSTNGEIEVPFSENETGGYFSMFRDKYGIEWMINFKNN